MQVTREELNPCTVKLTFNLEPDEVKQGYEAAFRQLTKKVRLPGFRPGKAPRAMLTQYVSAEEWNDEAAEEMVRRAFPKAIEDEKLEIDRTTAPKISVTTIDKELQKFEFEATVPLPPKVEVGDYKGLPVEQPDAAVSDEEVDFELNELRKQRQTSVFVTDRGIDEGDVAVLNIKKVGEEGEGKNFMTIAGQTFPQLDQAIMGMRVEEMKNLELTFPETFQQKEWAGQTFQAQVTANSLSSVRMPELDDSFAQSLKAENVDALRNRIREAIGAIKQQMVRTIVHERLVDELMGRSKVFVSDNMWENLATRRLRELALEQADKKKSLEEYAKENGMTLEEFAAAWQSKAKLEVERALLVQAVFGQEKMEIDNRELNLELLAMAQEYSTSPEDLVEELRKNNALDELHFRTLTRKVGDFLLSNAEVRIQESSKA